MTVLRVVALVAAPVLIVSVGCTSGNSALTSPPTATPSPASRAAEPKTVTTLPITPAPSPTSARALQGPTFVLLRAKDVTANARLNFMGQGFLPGEQTSVTVENQEAVVEATLESVNILEDGRFDEVSYPVPGGLTPGTHVLRVAGTASGRSARATFRLRWLPPTIKLDAYSGKAKHSFSFSGSGFAPGEQVEVRLGGLGGSPLASYPADAEGAVIGRDVPIPLIEAGDYPLYFVGQESQSPVSIGFNVQGFRPWAVLDNYSPPPYYLMGFSGEDFVPGEVVLVYLNRRATQPVTQVQADATGRFTVKNGFELPPLKGENQVIFVGQQSSTEITANFMAMAFGPSLELTAYAGRPGSHVAFVGTGWARNETLHVSMGETGARQKVGTFQADETGAFRNAGDTRVPVRALAGGLPLTVSGEISQAEVTLWFQILDLKPSAELTAYQGPPGTVVSFTGRSFASGERIRVHLRDRNGPELAQAVADDEGTFERLSSYPVDGDWGDVVPFVMVGEESGADATTHFKFANL
jgi:hypothetical protein